MRSLLSATERAFTATTLSESDPIAMPTVDDEGVSQFFRGRVWQSLTASELRQNEFAPTIFTSAAFAYFAPSYIAAYIVDPHTLDCAVESFIQNLGASSNPAIPQYHRARDIYQRFSAEQLEVIQDFLHLYVTKEGSCGRQLAEQALALYDAA